jgi:hypothetical protein
MMLQGHGTINFIKCFEHLMGRSFMYSTWMEWFICLTSLAYSWDLPLMLSSTCASSSQHIHVHIHVSFTARILWSNRKTFCCFSLPLKNSEPWRQNQCVPIVYLLHIASQHFSMTLNWSEFYTFFSFFAFTTHVYHTCTICLIKWRFYMSMVSLI